MRTPAWRTRDEQHRAAAQQLIGPLCLRAWGLHVRVCVCVCVCVRSLRPSLPSSLGTTRATPALAAPRRAPAPSRACSAAHRPPPPRSTARYTPERPCVLKDVPAYRRRRITFMALQIRVLRPEEDGSPRAARAATVTGSGRVMGSTTEENGPGERFALCKLLAGVRGRSPVHLTDQCVGKRVRVGA